MKYQTISRRDEFQNKGYQHLVRQYAVPSIIKKKNFLKIANAMLYLHADGHAVGSRSYEVEELGSRQGRRVAFEGDLCARLEFSNRLYGIQNFLNDGKKKNSTKNQWLSNEILMELICKINNYEKKIKII